MSDKAARQRARTAAAEDTPEARAALLRDELRQGADPGLTRWCAYAGGEEERLALGWEAGGNGRVYYPAGGASVGAVDALWLSRLGHEGLNDWFKRLPSLAEACSLADVDVACKSARRVENGLSCRPSKASNWEPCHACRGTGVVTRVPVGARWLLVRTGLEVGRACRAWLHRSRPGPGGGDAQLAAGRWLRVVRASGRALDAAQAWVDCPCEEHLRAWAALYRDYTPDWVPNPVAMVRTTVESLPTYFGWQMKAAARLLPPETIRSCVLRVGREEQQRKRESV